MNTNRAILFLVVISSPFLTAGNASGQCCSPGNPIGGTGNLGVLPKGDARLTLSYDYSYSGKYFHERRRVEPYFVKAGFYQFSRLSFSYGVSSRLTIDTEVAYFIKKAQKYVDGILPTQRSGRGISNAAFSINFQLYRDLLHRWEITSGVGLKAPIGSYRHRGEGGLLPLDIQPTTGGYDFIHSLFFYHAVPVTKLGLFLTNRTEFKGTNRDGYKFGDLLVTSVFATYEVDIHWGGVLQLRSEKRWRDRRPTGSVPTTGSLKFFITPQINYLVGESVVISGLVDIPVYQYYNREQLGNSYALSLAIIKKFRSGPFLDFAPGDLLK